MNDHEPYRGDHPMATHTPGYVQTFTHSQRTGGDRHVRDLHQENCQ
jgi:hypothetical protein